MLCCESCRSRTAKLKRQNICSVPLKQAKAEKNQQFSNFHELGNSWSVSRSNNGGCFPCVRSHRRSSALAGAARPLTARRVGRRLAPVFDSTSSRFLRVRTGEGRLRSAWTQQTRRSPAHPGHHFLELAHLLHYLLHLGKTV